MIPPPAFVHYTPEESNMNCNMFNMRPSILTHLAATKHPDQNQSDQLIHINRTTRTTSPMKSLELLRKSLQTVMSRDIDAIIQNYLNKYFQPAIKNINQNLGTDCVTDDNVKEICRQILEDTKQIYHISENGTPMSHESSSMYDCSDSDTSSYLLNYKLPPKKEFDAKSKRPKKSLTTTFIPTTSTVSSQNQNQNQNPFAKILKRDNAKWNSDRITDQTMFIMGARANKVLGFGQTRGRLYVRHPELVRYSSDQDDKEWLIRNNLMPPNGGKAYLMLLDDIQELLETEDYRNNPNVQVSELRGFQVPSFILTKIRTYIDSVRDENNRVMSSLLMGTSNFNDFGPVNIGCNNFAQIPPPGEASSQQVSDEKQPDDFLDNDCLLSFPTSDSQMLHFFP